MSRTVKEIIIAAVILTISICLSIPALIKDEKEYKAVKEKEDISLKDWAVSTPEAQGMDQSKINEADEYIKGTDALSLIIVRHEKLVFEKYYNNSSRKDYNNVYSVTKSFVSALAGIATDNGYISSIDEKATDYFPQYKSSIDDPAKNEITIRHLLTMTPGFIEDLDKMTGSPDWIKYTFDLPLLYKPGERFQYANSASHMLSVILSKATGMSTADFAEKYLFEPLNITEKRWMTDPQGFNTGYANLYLRPIDMAKLGQLYLSNGMWKGKRLISSEWVKESTRKQVDTDPNETRGTPAGYGYKWWISEESGHSMYAAVGYGGQYICVIPDLDLIAVMTSLPGRGNSLNDEDKFRLLNEYIISSVIK